MPHLEAILWKREHFPLLTTRRDAAGKTTYELRRSQIPPYHPLMNGKGIPFETVHVLLSEVVQATLLDYEELAEKKGNLYQWTLQQLQKDTKGSVVFEPRRTPYDSGERFENIPFLTFGSFYVDRKHINPYGEDGDQGIALDFTLSSGLFNVPAEVVVSPELAREYALEDQGVIFDYRTFSCPSLWYQHNLTPANAFFYRNLVIALDNFLVRKKYEEVERK